MTNFLLATLYAPLASWGDIAVGEVRGSWDRPSRSAILGLIAAALGLTRDEQAAHDALDAGYGVAVRLVAVGEPCTDYHTAQTVGASTMKKAKPRTRGQMLALGDPHTILSYRSLRQDALSVVVLWCRGEPAWSLGALAEALRRPVYVLFAGRKANALGLPVYPQLVSAVTLGDAFLQVSPVPSVVSETFRRPQGGWGTEVAHDHCEGFSSGLRPLRREIRRDAAAHRMRWQFSERVVEVGELLPGAAT